MLDVRRMQVLRAVITSGSITAAARNLGYTPSAISQQLSALEREAGTELLERVGRGVRPTPAGSLLSEHAETLSTELAKAEAALTELKEGRIGRVAIRYFATAGASLVPPAIAAVRREHPGVRLDLKLVEPDDPMADVEVGRRRRRDHRLPAQEAARQGRRAGAPARRPVPRGAAENAPAGPQARARPDGVRRGAVGRRRRPAGHLPRHPRQRLRVRRVRAERRGRVRGLPDGARVRRRRHRRRAHPGAGARRAAPRRGRPQDPQPGAVPRDPRRGRVPRVGAARPSARCSKPCARRPRRWLRRRTAPRRGCRPAPPRGSRPR